MINALSTSRPRWIWIVLGALPFLSAWASEPPDRGSGREEAATHTSATAQTFSEPSPGDWPGFWGPHRNARVHGSLEVSPGMSLREVWRRPLGGGYSEVAVVAGRGYTMFSDGENDHLLAFDSATGKEIWSTRMGMTRKGEGGSHAGALSSPVFHRGRIIALDPFGKLFSFDAETGEVLWRRDLPAELGAEVPDFGFGTTPLPLGDLLIVQAGGTEHNVVALEAATGTTRWSSNPAEGYGYASPSVMTFAENRQIVAATSDQIFGLDPKDGTVLWTHEAMGEARQSPVSLPGDRLFVNFWDESAVLEIRLADPGWEVREIWRAPVFKANYSPTVYHDGHLYGMNRSYLSCLDAETGKLRWRQKIYESTLMLVDQTLAILGEKSGRFQLVAAAPEGFTELVKKNVFTPGARSMTGPMFINDRFLLRNLEEMVLLEPVTSGAAVPEAQGGGS